MNGLSVRGNTFDPGGGGKSWGKSKSSRFRPGKPGPALGRKLGASYVVGLGKKPKEKGERSERTSSRGRDRPNEETKRGNVIMLGAHAEQKKKRSGEKSKFS